MDIVVKLFTTSRGFAAVEYNMDKVERGDAELLLYKNFGIIEAFISPQAADFQHYLGAYSSLGTRSWYKQFHAVLSVKGKSLSSESLKNFALDWLKEMGYSNQPFMIFFHSDTKNNHVHLVSTSIQLSGKKFSDSYNRLRAMHAIHKLLGIDVDAVFKADVSPLLDYQFSSLCQLSILLKGKGYGCYSKDNAFFVRKYGKTFLKLSEEKLKCMILTSEPDTNVIEGYRLAINLALKLKDNTCIGIYQTLDHPYAKRLRGFRSELSDFLFDNQALEIFYHFKSAAITGFTLIDHRNRRVIEGSSIMDLNRLIEQKFTTASRDKSLIR